MSQTNPLKQIVVKRKEGKPTGIYSRCSASDYVIEAALECIKRGDFCVSIETIANQADQSSGYTEMTPKNFRELVLRKAKVIGVDKNHIFLGGDHLGPLTLAALPEEEAMEEAEELARCYVAIGFTEIRIGTGMKIADDDPNIRLGDAVIAKHDAHLARICEGTYQELLKQDPSTVCPVYVAGNEIPTPGGAQEEGTGTQVTRVEDFKATARTFEEAFATEGLKEIWKGVVGVVVQLSVEEKDDGYTEYDCSKIRDLIVPIREYPDPIFGGHSTDYQTEFRLRELIGDGVGILKVGPGLTYAMREALFTFADIKTAVYRGKEGALSNLINVLEEAMMEESKNWKKRHHGDDNALWFRRKYNFSDRSHYYMPNSNVTAAKDKLIVNSYKSGISLSVLSQFMSIRYIEVREGHLENDPKVLIRGRIVNTIGEYLYATHQEILF